MTAGTACSRRLCVYFSLPSCYQRPVAELRDRHRFGTERSKRKTCNAKIRDGKGLLRDFAEATRLWE